MLRLIKSDAEIKLLRESASLASRAIIKVRERFLSLTFIDVKYLVLRVCLSPNNGLFFSRMSFTLSSGFVETLV